MSLIPYLQILSTEITALIVKLVSKVDGVAERVKQWNMLPEDVRSDLLRTDPVSFNELHIPFTKEALTFFMNDDTKHGILRYIFIANPELESAMKAPNTFLDDHINFFSCKHETILPYQMQGIRAFVENGVYFSVETFQYVTDCCNRTDKNSKNNFNIRFEARNTIRAMLRHASPETKEMLKKAAIGNPGLIDFQNTGVSIFGDEVEFFRRKVAEFFAL